MSYDEKSIISDSIKFDWEEDSEDWLKNHEPESNGVVYLKVK